MVDAAAFRDFYAPARSKTDEELDPLVRSAARWVKKLAPPPETADTDYEEAADDGQLQVARYLFTSHLSSSGKGLDTLRQNEGYVSDPKVINAILQQTMGDYHLGSKGANTAYVGRMPI